MAKVWRLLFILFVLGQGIRGQSTSDVQFWSELDLSANLARNWTLLVPMVIRNSESAANPVLVGFGPIVTFAINQHVSLTGGYLFADLPDIAGGLTVHVPLAAVTFTQKVGRLEIEDRNRGERLIGIPHHPFRYRNRLSLQLPVASGRWRLFVNDEVFYDFGARGWNQNRLQVGVSRTLSPRFKLDLYYLERSLHMARPNAVHVVGTTLGIRVR